MSHLHGQDNTWAAQMTDAQKKQAEAPWHDENGRPWTALRIAGDMAVMAATFAGLYVLGCVL